MSNLINSILSPLGAENTEINNSFGAETKTLDTFNDTQGSAVFYEYYITDGTNSRAGHIIGHWNSTTNLYDTFENTTADLGYTTGVVLSLDIDNNLVRLRVVSSQANFIFKALRRII